ncbi:MAG TPA: hypothetical protein VKA95_02945 [Nitrososphaeraceae archaeon]|nr:hypothetical protein [Nitrososphaeraceae archaeon]
MTTSNNTKGFDLADISILKDFNTTADELANLAFVKSLQIGK